MKTLHTDKQKYYPLAMCIILLLCIVSFSRARTMKAFQRLLVQHFDEELTAYVDFPAPSLKLRILNTSGPIFLRPISKGEFQDMWMRIEEDRWVEWKRPVDGVALRLAQKSSVVELEVQYTVSSIRSGLRKPLDVVKRSEWGAQESRNDPTHHHPEQIVVHHTWRPSISSYKEMTTIRSIQRFHQASRGWDDIGYHYLIGPDGTIYQGRSEVTVGAHSFPNTGKIGVCVIGDYGPHGDALTAEAWIALQRIVKDLAERYDLGEEEVSGHRDHNPTECPGDLLYERLFVLKDVAERAVSGWPRRLGGDRKRLYVASFD